MRKPNDSEPVFELLQSIRIRFGTTEVWRVYLMDSAAQTKDIAEIRHIELKV